MKDQVKIKEGIGSGEVEGVWEESDGKRFCLQCGKMIREGQKVREWWKPQPLRRATKSFVQHVRCEEGS